MAETVPLFEFRGGRTPWALELSGVPSYRRLELIGPVERIGEGGEEEEKEEEGQVRCWEDQKRL